MTTFILVHGAFGSSAGLAPVIPELEALGHRAIAVDLPCTDPAATLDDYARTVVEPIEIASEHAVFTFRPRELAVVLAGQADRRSAGCAVVAAGSFSCQRSRTPWKRNHP